MSAPAARYLVVAKAPVAGRVKTRLGADIGLDVAADLAAAALLDTLAACDRAPGCTGTRHLSLDGHLPDAVRGSALVAAVDGWHVHPQVGDGFDARLARAHADVADAGPGPVVQVGMDTPQVTPHDLAAVLAGLAEHDAVLAPAADGGWWALALRDPRAAAALDGVPMSTATTGRDTRAALEGAGLRVGTAHELVDVDTVAEADAVAALAPDTLFARAWVARTPGIRTTSADPDGHR